MTLPLDVVIAPATGGAIRVGAAYTKLDGAGSCVNAKQSHFLEYANC